MTPFPCDKCGACCRHLYLFGKPYAWLLDGQSGMCRYFDPQRNLCAIYPVRPVICNLEQGWRLLFGNMSWQEFVRQNQAACAMLKKLSTSDRTQ